MIVVVKLPVSETFYSVQGEGINLGIPALFIRVFGCNLRCKWCDSAYSYKGDYTLFSIDQIKEIVERSPVETVILTGGEPSIYYKFFSSLIDFVPATYFMETNGTIYSEELAKKLNFVTISPKLSSSGARFDLNIIQQYIDNFRTGELKFVIDNQHDLEDATMIINKLSIKDDIPVVFQPAEVSGKHYLQQIEAVYRLISENQFLNNLKRLRFIPQMHKLCNLK